MKDEKRVGTHPTWAIEDFEIITDFEEIKRRARERGEDVDGDLEEDDRLARTEHAMSAGSGARGGEGASGDEDRFHARAVRLRALVERRAKRLDRAAARVALARLLGRPDLLEALSHLSRGERAAFDTHVRLAVGPQEGAKLRREVDGRATRREAERKADSIAARKRRAASERGIRNHTVEYVPGEEGKLVELVTALSPEEVELHMIEVNEEFPKRIGEQLFVDDGEDGIDFLNSRHELFRWYLEETEGAVFWRRGVDQDDRVLMTQDEAFSFVTRMAECVRAIEEHPLWPVPEGVYLTMNARRELPKVAISIPGTAGHSSDTNAIHEGRVEEFLGFFNPADAASYALVEALLLTILWGGAPGARPLFVVTGPRGAGKSTLVRKLARLGGGCAQIDLGHGRAGEPLGEQILADTNLTRRVVLLDNAEGYLRSPELAQWITAEEIEARPKFSQRRRRLNLITYVATVVDPSLDSDLAARSVVLRLHETSYTPRWENEVDAFLDEHGDELIAEALARLQHADKLGARGELRPGDRKGTRFPRWDERVLAVTRYPQAVFEGLRSSSETVNEDLENLARFLDLLREEWKPEMKPKELTAVWNEANTSRASTGWVMRTLRGHATRGELPEGLRRKWEHRNGSPWLVNVERLGSPSDQGNAS